MSRLFWIAAALGTGALVAAAATSTTPGSAPAAPSVTTPRTATRGAEVFGINDPVSIPKLFIDKGLLPRDREPVALGGAARLAAGLGAGIIRGTTPVYPYLDQQSMEASGWDWTRPDNWMRAVQNEGYQTTIMVGPWPGNKTAAFTDHYLPKDMDAYTAYVTKVVERYDGDGIDDMPGLLKGNHFWEVDNEPDLHNSHPPRELAAKAKPENFETPEEYAKVLVASSKAIRAADNKAVVLSAGFWLVRTPQGQAYLSSVFDQPGAVDAIDVANVHCYFQEDSLDAIDQTLAVVNQVLPGKAIWVTETSVPSGEKLPWQTEDWQAGMVAAIYGAFLAGGADRIFWHTLGDPPADREDRGKGARSPFETNSLLRTVARINPEGNATRKEDKPAGALFRRLAGLMAETPTAEYRPEPATGGRLLWTGRGWLAYWGNPTLPAGAQTVTDLRTGEMTGAKGTAAAPAWVGVGR